MHSNWKRREDWKGLKNVLKFEKNLYSKAIMGKAAWNQLKYNGNRIEVRTILDVRIDMD